MASTPPRAGEKAPQTHLDLGCDLLQDRLVDHLKRGRLAVGAHLKEQDLADALGVSRTPIRRILRSLAEKNIVEARAKRGFFMLISSDDLFEPTIDLPVTDEASLFNRITFDRLSGEIPDEFDEGFLAARYGVSHRMTERVLAELRAEGVIQPLSRKRHRFNPALLSAAASDASYEYRLVIETAIPLLPGFAIEPAVLHHARRVHERFIAAPAEQADGRIAYRIDADFHEMIATGSRNPHFQTAVAQQNRLRQLMEYRDYNNRRRVASWCREHLDIIDALEAGDRERASALIGMHLRNAMSYRPREDPRALTA